MRVVVAPDSFKGSASALEVCRAMREGILEACCDAEVILAPMTDGGEGLVENLSAAYDCKSIRARVMGPAGRPVEAEYCILTGGVRDGGQLNGGQPGDIQPDGGVCVIEMAQAAGLTLLSDEERDPLCTTTYGVGELIRDALDRGCKTFIIGLGGSATNDGGCGMAAALGYRFLDENGKEIGLGGGCLGKLAEIRCDKVDPRLREADFAVACDVRNPLCGENGASYVFGPQKGADPERVRILDANMSHLADIIKRDLGKDVRDIPGAGAAGGMGAGTMAFLDGRLMEGVKIISEMLGLEDKIKGADLVFTGEGKFDAQTLSGKAPLGILSLARKYGVPVVIIAGAVDLGGDADQAGDSNLAGDANLAGADDLEIIGIRTEGMSLDYALEHVHELVAAAAKTAVESYMTKNSKNNRRGESMKKILVLGVGAQGSTAARKLDEEPDVGEIICADYDQEAVDSIVGQLTKAKGAFVDAHDLDSIVKAAEGVDLILNGLPLECTQNVLDAALIVKANYQDYAGTTALGEMWAESEPGKAAIAAGDEPEFEDPGTLNWYRSIRAMFELYGPKFEEIGKLAIFGTGSAPGLICAATKYAMRYLDKCETIYNFVWEGAIAKRFQPFWWSPITALNDMSEMALAFEGGKLINTPAFGRPITRQYPYMEERITFREHCHDEPLQYSFNADTHFKGCKNAYFKYAGAGMDFAGPLYEAGLLSHEEEEFNGQKIVPFDFILSHLPHAPKYEEEIKSFVDEGMALDSGCMVIEAYGTKGDEGILVEVHVGAPGFVESFEKAKMTGEMYLTGQGGYLFSKLFINDKFEGTTGVISSDMLTDEQVDEYFKYAAELGITLDTKIKRTWEIVE